MYTEDFADPDPATWIIDRKQRPARWPQRDWETESELNDPPEYDEPPKVARRARRTPVQDAPRATKRPVQSSGRVISRIAPEVVIAYLEKVGIDKREAAARLGVSYSRINELTTHTRPKSWLNSERWEDVKERLRAEAP